MPPRTRTLSEFGRLTRVLLKHPREAFRSEEAIDAEWSALNFSSPPSLSGAVDEYDTFVEILKTSGAQIDFLPLAEQTNLDSIYVRDATIVCSRGVILGRMGKRLRVGEPVAQKVFYRSMGVPVVGEITEP